jgi:hypothetical protein
MIGVTLSHLIWVCIYDNKLGCHFLLLGIRWNAYIELQIKVYFCASISRYNKIKIACRLKIKRRLKKTCNLGIEILYTLCI